MALVTPVLDVLAGVDDDFGLCDGGLALVFAALYHAGEVVHGVEVHVVQLLDFGFDVARHGQIDHEHRPVPPRLQRAFDGAEAAFREAEVAGATAALVLVAGALWWTFERRTEAIRTALQRRLLR